MNSKQQALIEKFNSKLDQAQARIDLLAAKAREADASGRLRLQQEMDNIREHKSALEKQADELKNASGQAWEDLKDGAEAGWKALAQAVDRAASRYGI
jgi:FtsZ-binding cell division protein ZapB